MPTGGTTGQVLQKASATDYDTEWVTLSAGSDPWTVVRLTSDFETTGTANVAVTGLSFTPAANTRYWFQAILFLQAAATTTGARPGLSWPSGTTQEVAWAMSPNSGTAFASRFWGAPTTQNAAATGVAVANEGLFGRIEGMLVTGASPSGVLQVTLASEVSGSAARVMANSILMYRTIS